MEFNHAYSAPAEKEPFERMNFTQRRRKDEETGWHYLAYK